MSRPDVSLQAYEELCPFNRRPQRMTPSEALYCIDMGTTNCRVFLTQGNRVWARVEAGVNGSRHSSPRHLKRPELPV
jgi:hypothetical protein